MVVKTQYGCFNYITNIYLGQPYSFSACLLILTAYNSVSQNEHLFCFKQTFVSTKINFCSRKCIRIVAFSCISVKGFLIYKQFQVKKHALQSDYAIYIACGRSFQKNVSTYNNNNKNIKVENINFRKAFKENRSITIIESSKGIIFVINIIGLPICQLFSLPLVLWLPNILQSLGCLSTSGSLWLCWHCWAPLAVGLSEWFLGLLGVGGNLVITTIASELYADCFTTVSCSSLWLSVCLFVCLSVRPSVWLPY